MKKRIHLILFLLIIALGIILRFYQLGNIPSSLEWDEVSIGYNAYSVLHTGKDEFGQILPTAFRAFGEYKQPVYIYLDAASIGIFGLNAFAVRFPSALFGSLAIIFVYFLTKELFWKQKFSERIALLSMFFFAISPWSIQFSRAAFEANVSLSFIIGGIWLLLRGLRSKKQWYFYLAIALLVLSTYTYISAKLIVPLLLVCFAFYGRAYFASKKLFGGILIAGFLILSFLWVLDTRSVARSQGVFFTNQKSELLETPIKQMEIDIQNNDQLGSLLHNRRVVYAQTLVNNYLTHFNPLWLFVQGDEVKRHHAPGFGLLYLISLPFILAGIYFLLSRQFQSTWILFAWFLIAPIASTLTFEAPHSLRSLVFLPTWQIFEAAGIIFVLQFLKKAWLKKAFIAAFSILLLLNFVYYIHQYFVHTNTDDQKDWQYGYKEAMIAADKVSEGKRVIFASHLEQPYIFYLFHNQYDPKKYIEEGNSSRMLKKCYTIDNAYFGDCLDQLRNGDIYISAGDAEIKDTKLLQSINYTNGDPAVRIFQYK